MNAVVVSMGQDDPHSAVQALLPWYARGQLDAADARDVHEHLLQCPACRAELEAEGPMQALLSVTASAPDHASVEAGLARMRVQMKKKAQAPASSRSRWWPWALGLQGCAIAVLLTLVVLQTNVAPPAAYKGLASGEQPGKAEALIMFRADAGEARIREVLKAHGATLVGGPTESGAYLLHLDPSPQALERLRAEPVVTLVESLEPGAHR